MINYKKIDAHFTEIEQDLEPEKWLELRKTGIGGSDAGAIMGLNSYSSPLTVYFQKKGIQGFKGNLATEWGQILEEPIRQKTREELGVEIITVPGMYRSKEHYFMNANLDGLMDTGDKTLSLGDCEVKGLGGHEIKTSSHGAGFSDDEIPDSYYCQVQHYMAVTGLQWFILTVFFLDKKVGKHYIVLRNEDFINVLIEKETNFWENYVMVDKIPEPLGVDSENEYLQNVQLDEEVICDEETEKLIEEEKEIESRIKELDSKKSELKNKIILKLVENSTGKEGAEKTIAKVGSYKLSYSTQIKKSVDSAMLKKDGLFDKYSKESSYKTLRISELKNE